MDKPTIKENLCNAGVISVGLMGMAGILMLVSNAVYYNFPYLSVFVHGFIWLIGMVIYMYAAYVVIGRPLQERRMQNKEILNECSKLEEKIEGIKNKKVVK